LFYSEQNNTFGEAGSTVVIEELLEGEEFSVSALDNDSIVVNSVDEETFSKVLLQRAWGDSLTRKGGMLVVSLRD